MKISKYLLGFALLGLALTSCDTDNEGAIYKASDVNVSFENEDLATVTTDKSSITVPVRIIRGDKTGAFTASYTTKASAEGIFSDDCNGSVTFADGEAVKIINVTASNMVVGNKYSYEIILSDATMAHADTVTNSAIASTKVNIMCDYNWVDAGTATFTDYTWGDEDGNPVSGEVKMVQAEGTTIYRLIAPVATVYEGIESGGDTSNFEFTVDANKDITFPDGIYLNFWGYKMYYDSATYGAYCFVEREGNTYGINFLLLNGTSLYTGGYFEITHAF